ncbi:MAG TPA: outer membrane beta-barrel protein [Gemmatimonadales bacterium]|nr:outer membrane beta-barrel protein [Gemmatimonadales bacterium]
MKTRGLLLALVVAGTAPAAAQVPGLDIDLRIGANSTSFSETPVEFEDRNANTNYFVGGDIRFGGLFFIQPGLYYQKQGFEFEGDAEGNDQSIGISSFMIPVQVGVNLDIPLIALEMAAGPTVTFNTESDNLPKEELNNTRFGALVSAKIDVLFIGAWVGYQWDFTDTSDGGFDGHMSQWMVGIGINF